MTQDEFFDMVSVSCNCFELDVLPAYSRDKVRILYRFFSDGAYNVQFTPQRNYNARWRINSSDILEIFWSHHQRWEGFFNGATDRQSAVWCKYLESALKSWIEVDNVLLENQ